VLTGAAAMVSEAVTFPIGARAATQGMERNNPSGLANHRVRVPRGAALTLARAPLRRTAGRHDEDAHAAGGACAPAARPAALPRAHTKAIFSPRVLSRADNDTPCARLLQGEFGAASGARRGALDTAAAVLRSEGAAGLYAGASRALPSTHAASHARE
jgi:hypothetical protein